jgi:hypothetical protein
MVVSLNFPKVFPDMSLDDVKNAIENQNIGKVTHINAAPRSNNTDGTNCHMVYAHVDWNMASETGIYLARQIVSPNTAKLYINDKQYIVVRFGPPLLQKNIKEIKLTENSLVVYLSDIDSDDSSDEEEDSSDEEEDIEEGEIVEEAEKEAEKQAEKQAEKPQVYHKESWNNIDDDDTYDEDTEKIASFMNKYKEQVNTILNDAAII